MVDILAGKFGPGHLAGFCQF